MGGSLAAAQSTHTGAAIAAKTVHVCGIELPEAPASPIPLRPLGWAGLLLWLPAHYRLAKVIGSGSRGRLDLIDHQRLRVSMAWSTERLFLRRFKARAAIERHFTKLARQFRDRRPAARRWEEIPNPSLEILGCYPCEDRQTDFYAGYSPATGRCIQLTYRRAEPADNVEDKIIRQVAVPGLRDQSPGSPALWSVFGLSFVAPAGLQLGTAKMVLGDMGVELWSGRAREAGPSLGVREIYPSRLALARRPLEEWLRTWLRPFAPVYRPAGGGLPRRRPVPVLPVQTPRGPGVSLDLHLAAIYRPVFRRAPRTLRLWMLEDQAIERLVGVSMGVGPDQLDSGLSGLLAGLHWAGLGD
jgi:hypothetical protein